MSGLQEDCNVAPPLSSGDSPGAPGLVVPGGKELSTYLSEPSLSEPLP